MCVLCGNLIIYICRHHIPTRQVILLYLQINEAVVRILGKLDISENRSNGVWPYLSSIAKNRHSLSLLFRHIAQFELRRLHPVEIYSIILETRTFRTANLLSLENLQTGHESFQTKQVIPVGWDVDSVNDFLGRILRSRHITLFFG